MIYLVFAGKEYYPEGGVQDLLHVYGSYLEAKNRFDEEVADELFDWVQIASVNPVDLKYEILDEHYAE